MSAENPQPDSSGRRAPDNNTNNNNNNNNNSGPSDEDPDDANNHSPLRRPVQRDRTPSIIVQSLELSFSNKELLGASSQQQQIEEDEHQQEEEQQPHQQPMPKDEESSSDSNNDPAAPDPRRASINEQSASGSMASLHNSSAPRVPASLRHQQSTAGSRSPSSTNLPPGGNRRLSLTIGSTAPRRLSLTVDGMSSFINPAYKDLPAASAYSSGSATGSLRNKVALKPGHSLMGWVKLASTAKDLSGTNGKIIEVTPEELAKHDKEEDCWVAIKGNVYNVTTYLQYHPGGVEELMRGAGKEITDLFNEVHCWVNYESILAKCLVGPYKMESPIATYG